MLGFRYEIHSWQRAPVTILFRFSSDLVVSREILHDAFRVELALQPYTYLSYGNSYGMERTVFAEWHSAL